MSVSFVRKDAAFSGPTTLGFIPIGDAALGGISMLGRDVVLGDEAPVSFAGEGVRFSWHITRDVKPVQPHGRRKRRNLFA